MKKAAGIIGGIVLLAGAAGLGYAGWNYLKEDKVNNENVVYVTTVSSLTETAFGTQNRYAGVVEPQKTLDVKLESGRKVKEVCVQVGQDVKAGDVLFEYDLSSMQDDLTEKQLEYDQLLNEAESIKEQIITYTKERDKAKNDQKLSYTIQIETSKMALKKNGYNQKSKAAEIEKLKQSMTQTQVLCEMDGVIKKIDTSKMDSEDGSGNSGSNIYDNSDGNSNAFITILSTGAYRVKGKVNEQNMQSIMIGQPVIIRSRVDEAQTWRGTMGSIDTENTSNDNNNMYYFGMGGTDTQTTSSNYAFYVELDSSEGLMLGQHVYIEMDQGQADAKEGIWLDEFFIVDADTSPYVWGSTGDDKLQKIPVTLGEYDINLGKYQILEGLSVTDCIAFPMEGLEEGMAVAINDSLQIPTDAAGMEWNAGGTDDMIPSIEDEMEGVPAELDDTMVPMDDTDAGSMDMPEDLESIPMEEIPDVSMEEIPDEDAANATAAEDFSEEDNMIPIGGEEVG